MAKTCIVANRRSCIENTPMLVAITCALLSATAARAAETEPASQTADPDTIIVTANKRAEQINKVPMSITAITGKDLISRGVVDVASLERAVPGFKAVDSSYGTPVYYLRGIGFFDTTLTARPTVNVYVDEVPIAHSVMTLGAMLDVERVEVLKGPQGILFGSNSTGGAVNFVAAKPKREFGAGLNGSFGRFNETNSSGYVTGPVSSTLSARIAVGFERRSDWQKSLTRADTLGSKDFLQGSLQLLWEPSSSFRAHLRVAGFRDNSDPQAAQFVFPFQQTLSTAVDPRLLTYPSVGNNARLADWTAGGTIPLRKRNRMVQTSLRLELDLTDSMSLTSLSSYAHYG